MASHIGNTMKHLRSAFGGKKYLAPAVEIS